MVKEIALLPEVPKCLTNFDPTKFRPDWKASGRRWRVDKAAKCLDEVGEALYSKGVVRMSLMAAVDDSRKVCHIVVIIDVVIVIIVVIIVASPPLTFINPQTVKVLSAAPPGTPIAVFLENHKEEMELAIRQSQLMVTAACRIADAPHMTIPDKFSALRGHFGAREPTREETEQDILDIRRKTPHNRRQNLLRED